MNEISFEKFVEDARNGILSYLPSEYENARVEISQKTKVNRKATGMQVIPEESDTSIVPSLSLDNYYESIIKGASMDSILERMADTIVTAYRDLDTLPYRDNPMEHMDKSKVYMQIANTDSNHELAANAPHRDFHDMTVFYRILYDKSPEGIQSVLITNDLADTIGVTEEELFELASKQTKELFPPKIESMSSVISKFFSDAGMDDPSMLEDMGMDEEFGMYLISNDTYVYGATSMIYDDVLYDAASRLGENVYILPSSLHEVLVVPCSVGDPEELSKMVREINQNTVREDERLSNQVFKYDKEARSLTQVSDGKMLGIKDENYKTVIEPPTPSQTPFFDRSAVPAMAR